MRQFWNDQVTIESEEFMQEFCRQISCVVIGGWATYLHTKTLKSKDLDVVVGYEQLSVLKQTYSRLVKNERLTKYEIKLQDKGFDIDIYLPDFSDIGFDLKQVTENSVIIDGISVPKTEELLALKLNAYANRKGSQKGEKDARDIVSLLFHGNVNLQRLYSLSVFSRTNLKNELESLIKNYNKFDDLDINEYQYKRKIKSKFIST